MLRCNQKGCLTSFTPLTHLPAFTTDGGRGALSNNILGSVPEHPFWVLITESLRSYDWNYVFPYITISYASGQWFETAIWVCAFLSFFYLPIHLPVPV
jgi:mannosyltransferase OCH1-like enzyme